MCWCVLLYGVCCGPVCQLGFHALRPTGSAVSSTSHLLLYSVIMRSKYFLAHVVLVIKVITVADDDHPSQESVARAAALAAAADCKSTTASSAWDYCLTCTCVLSVALL